MIIHQKIKEYLDQKFKEYFQKAYERLDKTYQNFTGKTMAKKIDEYSEVYGQILLGMHKDLSTLRNEINAIEEKLNKISNQKEIDHTEFQRMKKYLTMVLILSIISLIVSLFSMFFK